ncbi:exodeoxyribonuclease VII large subunit [Indivirus ILV1]|uniref:Exodeoxyribonuclease VII large subunit n=1 Tax=Indivirus ILV1 TaxID=1977633 RepID=A0A1V0SD82_9VIRU|nr:exodeoxyribonuclease VII large subunit [Indivirus ILV1]
MNDQDQSITVSELTSLIKDTFSETFGFTKLCVVGEISNFKPSKNNVFFTLKDETASINAVMWNYSNKKDKMEDIKDGKKVMVSANISIFQKSGTYNLNCHSIELLGIGNLFQYYNDLKEKFAKLGYFDEANKKSLPSNLNTIGIITAIDGAALQDFLYVIKNNNFSGKIYIKNCLVQGNDCPNDISKAIKELDSMELDLIIIARGGGSFEDLFGFSSEQVVEAIKIANTCIMSAIGHEVDFMLSDFVADIRAPTPSIAGELVSGKKVNELNIDEIKLLSETIKNMVKSKIENNGLQLNNYKILLKSPLDFIDKIIQDIDMIQGKFLIAIRNKLFSFTSILETSKSIQVIPQIYQDEKKITCINDIKKGKKLKMIFYDGEVIINPKDIVVVKYE